NRKSIQSCHSAIKRLVSRVPPLFRFDEKAKYFPSFENTGKASKVLLWVTRSRFFPSISIKYRLKGNPLSDSKLLENKIFSPEGWKNGAQLALPKCVNCRRSLPSALQMNSSISVGCTKP